MIQVIQIIQKERTLSQVNICFIRGPLRFWLFKISLLLALIPANLDVDKTFFSLIYTNVMIPNMNIVLLYIL